MTLQNDKKPEQHVIELIETGKNKLLIPHVDGKMLPGAQSVVVHNVLAVRYAEITLRVFLDDFRIVTKKRP